MSEERNWSRSIRIVMLQTVITGKAQEAYALLTMEDRKDYDKVKVAIFFLKPMASDSEAIYGTYRHVHSLYRPYTVHVMCYVHMSLLAHGRIWSFVAHTL